MTVTSGYGLGAVASAATVLGKLGYDVGLGLFLVSLDAVLTYFIVDRVIERQDERKRRALSGLAEARLLESLGGFLADGVPRHCREPSSLVLTVGRTEVSLQVESLDWTALEEQGDEHRDLMLNGLAGACDRYGDGLSQPLIAVIIEPKLLPDLVHFENQFDAARAILRELGETPSQEIALAASEVSQELFRAAWALRSAVVSRWR